MKPHKPKIRRSFAAYLLSLPGLLWLAVFFVVPMAAMFSISLQEGTIETGLEFTGNWRIYPESLGATDTQFIRSLFYALIVTVVTLIISYPMMYWIAFRGGRRKNLYLLLILLPFFTPFLIRTISWSQILADEGIFLGTLKDLNLIPESIQIMNSPTAVVCGMIYNFLPFMALPLYVSLERLDPSLLDAASDLYSNRVSAFFKVTFPLSLPGVFAGSLLTFIPSVGDFVDETLLGDETTTMIGNIIERDFTASPDYPEGAALSFLLMAGILIGVFLYSRALGTEELTG